MLSGLGRIYYRQRGSTYGVFFFFFSAYWGVFLSNIRVASAAHKASEVDCLLFLFVFLILCFSFYLFLGWCHQEFLVVGLSLLFSGGKHFGRRLTTVLQANPRRED
jgi:hypothetical protein